LEVDFCKSQPFANHKRRPLTSALSLAPIIGLRLYYLSPSENTNPTYTSIIPHILTEAASNFALVATSVTSLKPFLKPFHTGAIVNTVGGTGSGVFSGTRPQYQGIYMLAPVSGTKKTANDVTMTMTNATSRSNETTSGEREVKQPAKLYIGDNVPGQTVISASPGPQLKPASSRTGSDGSEQMIIKTTKEWNVRYEHD
jgi:hypothetical protein